MFRHHAKSFLRASVAVMLIMSGGVQAQTRQRVSASIRLKATLGGHTKSITNIEFSPDGETLATGSEDGTVRLWSTRTGAAKIILPLAAKHKLDALRWSDDGQKLATIAYRDSGKGQIQVWEARTGKMKAASSLNEDYGLSWSPNGRMLLTHTYERFARLWDAETGSLLATLVQAPPCPKRSLWKSLANSNNCSDSSNVQGYFVAEGQSVLTTSQYHSAKLWDAATGQLKTKLPLDEAKEEEFNYAYLPLLSPDKRLVVRTDSHGVTLVETTTAEVKHRLGEIGRPLAFSPDGRKLLTIEYAVERALTQVSLWDAATGQKLMRFEPLPAGVKDIYWSPQGNTLVVAGYSDMQTRLLNAETGRVIAKLPYDDCAPGSFFSNSGCAPFIFSADGRITLKQKNPLKLWDTETGELLATLDAASGFVRFSPTDQRLLVSRGKDKKTALLWEVSIQ